MKLRSHQINLFQFLLILTILYSSVSQPPLRKHRRKSASLPAPVISMLASREMRVHHYLFHQLRNQWNLIDEDTRQEIRDLGWEPPRPSRDANGNFITNNNSGEDFLYMHRQMIEQVNNILGKGNYAYGKKVVGWPKIPAPNDKDYPVPSAYFLDNAATTNLITTMKSDSFYNRTLKPADKRYKNAEVLRSMTLGQLGAFIEFQVHNQMHVRWSKDVNDYRTEPDPFYKTDEIPNRWDSPSYDWLNDFYASHVNSVFWKLHGWVDDRINDWQKANGLTTISWNGTWVGPMDMSKDSEDMTMFAQIASGNLKEKNERVYKILGRLEKNPRMRHFEQELTNK